MGEANGRGHYVGNFLSLEQDYGSHYMLEGDDIVIVDRADTLNGTGLEDAYNGGYYYNWVADPMDEPEGASPPSAIRPLNGILCVQKTTNPPFARAHQYRWMIGDRVSFTESIEVKVEWRYSLVGSRWKSVVFWYQLPIGFSSAPSPGGCPWDLMLQSIAPNPTSDAIVIRLELPDDGVVPLDLLDLTGRKVASISNGLRLAGLHEVHWCRGRQPNGVYFVRLRTGDISELQKLILIR